MANNPFNYEPGQRYFYFTSLLTSSNPLLQQIGQAGTAAVHNVKNVAQLQGVLEDGTRNDSGLIIQALEFLKRMQQAELAQEQKYFKQKAQILKQKKVTNKITSFFENANPEGGFNYLEFIAAINALYTDIESLKVTISTEQERLEKLDRIFSEVESWAKTSPEKYDADKAITSNAREYVLEEMRHFKEQEKWDERAFYASYFKTTTIGNAIQQRIQSIFNLVWKNTVTQSYLKKVIEKSGIRDLDMAKKLLVADLTMKFMTTASSEMTDLLEKIRQDAEKANDKQMLNSLNREYTRENNARANDIINLFFKGYSQGKTEQMIDSFIERFKAMENNPNQKNDLTRLMERIFINHYTITYDGNTIKGLTKNAIKALDQLLDQRMGKKSPTTSNTPAELKKRMVDYLNSLHIAGGKTHVKIDTPTIVAEMNKLIREADLVEFHIAGKDNLISEYYFANNTQRLGQAVGSLVLSALTTDGQKIDTSAIEIGEIQALPAYEQTINVVSDILNELLIKNSQISTEPITIERDGHKEIFDEAEWRREHDTGAGEFSIEAETLRREFNSAAILAEARTRLEKILKDSKEVEEVLEIIKNSVKLGATVKSYNKYENKHGFHGGSLGGDLQQQLANITKMLSYGGISIDDYEWLALAVYNTGAGMVGADLKAPLEAIFSAMGALLLFDDAGQQAEYIKNMTPTMIEESNPQFIHLYHLNNLYIPSSYVLARTIEAMESVATQLLGQSSMGYQGVKATINNNVREPAPGEHDMQLFFNTHASEVTITLTFLAGFLDIVAGINDALGN